MGGSLQRKSSFVMSVECDLERDLARSRTMTLDDVKTVPWWFKALARACQGNSRKLRREVFVAGNGTSI